MTFEESMREAARVAEQSVRRAMRKYSSGGVTDEDDITGVLAGNLDADFDERIGGLSWSSSVVRHRKGSAAEEKRIGADLVIHVKLDTPTRSYSKGVLLQAKRVEPNEFLSSKGLSELKGQCKKMLDVSASSFVIDYAKSDARLVSAALVEGSNNRDLYDLCNWTTYRFFLELCRCPIGDPRLTSAKVKDLPAPLVVSLAAEGQFSSGSPRLR